MNASAKRAPQAENGVWIWGAVVLILGIVVAGYGDAIAETVQGLATFSTAGLVVVVALVVMVVLAVVLPLLVGEAEPEDDPYAEVPLAHLGTPRQNRALEILYAEKERLLHAIRDLDFDYDLGKLADDAYAEQRVLLVRQSVAVMAKIEELENEIAAQQERIEAALAAFRQARRGQA